VLFQGCFAFWYRHCWSEAPKHIPRAWRVCVMVGADARALWAQTPRPGVPARVFWLCADGRALAPVSGPGPGGLGLGLVGGACGDKVPPESWGSCGDVARPGARRDRRDGGPAAGPWGALCRP
jgi:hypothetical protein